MNSVQNIPIRANSPFPGKAASYYKLEYLSGMQGHYIVNMRRSNFIYRFLDLEKRKYIAVTGPL